MQFTFNGTLDELKRAIGIRAKKLHRDIVVYNNDPDVLEIGFLRTGHDGGRFFIAKITREDGRVILDGEIKDTSYPPTPDTRSAFQRVLEKLLWLAVAYIALAFTPVIIWLVCDIPHIWIAFLLPLAVVMFFEIRALLHRGKQEFEAADRSFLQFMTMVTSGEITIPADSQELYEMLIKSSDLHSPPQIKDDIITWELYEKAYIKACLGTHDGYIDIISRSFPYTSLTHWHPDEDTIYDELYALGQRGSILVLRKSLLGTEVFYMGAQDDYPFTPEKKWHWGQLIYLQQSR